MEPYIIVGILTPVTLAVFAVSFFMAWRWAPEMKHARTLAVSYTLTSVAFLVPWLFLGISPAFGMLLCGISVLIGAVFFAKGIFERFNQPAPLKTLFLIVGINVATDFYTVFVLNDPLLSMQTSSVVAGLLLAVIGIAMRKLERRSVLEKIVPVAIATLGVFVVVHPFLASQGQLQPMNFSNYANSFEWITLNMMVLVSGLVTALTLISMIVSDINSRLQKLADIDSLSGLARRGVFERNCELMLRRADRSPLPITMITCDIDKFKGINDKFGHLAGDAVIAQFGSLIGSQIRETDVAGRLGGEEFGILLWNANAKSARLIAEQLRSAFSDTEYEGLMAGHHCTASFGIAQYEKGESYKSLFARADRALYQAKDSGRDRVVSFETRVLAA